jgi:hypothetical protein
MVSSVSSVNTELFVGMGSQPPAPAAGAPLRRGYSSGTISSATMLMILISGLIAGPAVSL